MVHEVAGTTRDVVDGSIEMAGVLVRLLDGAGIGSPRDSVDAEGMRRARETMGQSDLVVVVLDASRPLAASDLEVLELTENRDRIVVGNKSDLPGRGHFDEVPVSLVCSALTGAGVQSLRDALCGWVRERTGFDGDEGGIVASVRATEALAGCERSLLAALMSHERGSGPEALLVDLREALSGMSRTLGLDVEEEVLDRIFSSFCVGK